MANEPTFTIINQADANYCLAIRGGKVVLALVSSDDLNQQWMRKDAGTADKEGQPVFLIVNKATNEAIKHDGRSGPMSLVRYDASSKDSSILWTESKNEDHGFRYIRRAGLISHHITANCHKVEDGRIVDLYTGTHISERWKLAPCRAKPSNKEDEISEEENALLDMVNGSRADTSEKAPAKRNKADEISEEEDALLKMVNCW